MEILNPFSSVSSAQTAFTILPGKQITLHAKGLVDTDKVYIDILELSRAPDFSGNPCCTFSRNEIHVVSRTPLRCPDTYPAMLTADSPVGTLDAPQLVTLGVRVEADDAAVVSIELYETDSKGCLSCICDRPKYCPSQPLSCDGGNTGFGFHASDFKDPAATVPLAPCADDNSVDTVWVYPTSGLGHTVKLTDCDGNLLGYAANKSDCASDCGCQPIEVKVKVPATNVVVNPTNYFSPTVTTNVAAPAVTNEITLPAPTVAGANFDDQGELSIYKSDGTTVTAKLPSC